MTSKPLSLIRRLLAQRADAEPWLPLDYAAALTEMQAALGVTSAAAAIKSLRCLVEEDASHELSMDKSHVRAAGALAEQTGEKRRLPLAADDEADREAQPPSRRMRHDSELLDDMQAHGSVGANGAAESEDEDDADEAEIRRGAEGFDFGVAMLEAGEASGTAQADTDWLRGALAEDAEAVARGAASGAAIREAIGSAGPRSGRRRAPLNPKAHFSSSAAASAAAAAAPSGGSEGDSDSKYTDDDDNAEADSGVISVPPVLASELYSAADGPPGADGTSSRARTLFVGNVAPAVTAALLMELACQCGPVRMVRYFPLVVEGSGSGSDGAGLTRDASNDSAAAGGGVGGGRQGQGQGQGQRGYAFVEFEHEASLHYASRLLSGLPLCGQPLTAHPRHNFVSGGAAGVFMTDAGSPAADAAAGAASATAAAADYDAGFGGGGDGGPGRGGRGPAQAMVQLFVRPIPDGVDEWDLADLAAIALDAVAGVRLPRNADGRPRGFAFIDYPAAKAHEVMTVALPALRAGVYLDRRSLDFKVSDQSAQLPPSASPTGGEAGDDGAPMLTLGDAAQGGDAAGAGAGAGQSQLPVDARMLHALRVEALTALCRSIDARIRGWPTPAMPMLASSSSGFSQSPTPGPAGSPTGGRGYGYGSSSSSSGGFGAARAASAAAGFAAAPSSSSIAQLPQASAVAAAVMALDAAAAASSAGGGAATASDRRSRWDRDGGAGEGTGASYGGASSRDPSRDGDGYGYGYASRSGQGYHDRNAAAGRDRDRDRDRDRSADAARGASYGGHSSAYSYDHSYAPAPTAPLQPASHYGAAPAYGAMLPPSAAVADPAASYAGSAAAGPVAAALGRAWSGPATAPAQPLQYAAPPPAHAHAAAPPGYVLVPTSAQYVQAPPPPSGFVLVRDPSYRPSATQNLYGPPMDV